MLEGCILLNKLVAPCRNQTSKIRLNSFDKYKKKWVLYKIQFAQQNNQFISCVKSSPYQLFKFLPINEYFVYVFWKIYCFSVFLRVCKKTERFSALFKNTEKQNITPFLPVTMREFVFNFLALRPRLTNRNHFYQFFSLFLWYTLCL